MSEFHVEVVRIGEMRKHDNADSLSIVDVYGGYPVIVRTADFKSGDLAVYVPVDALVDVTRPEFAFLDGGHGRRFERLRARKLRGVFSMGLLVPAPAGAKEGDDLRAALGVEKWEPESEKEPARQFANTRAMRAQETVSFDRKVKVIGTACLVACVLAATWLARSSLHTQAFWTAIAFALTTLCLGGPVALACLEVIRFNRKRNQVPAIPQYDIEGARKHHGIFVDGEEVWITEKLHGCNAAFVHDGRRFWIKSRTVFRTDTECCWHRIAVKYGLEEKLKAHPNVVLFGEIYGDVQDLSYSVPKSEGVRFAAFDAMELNTRRFYDVDEFLAFCKQIDVPTVPALYRGAWSNALLSFAEGKTTMPGATHVREGIVIKVTRERRSCIGRAFLKLHGESFLLRKTKEAA